MRAYHLTCLRPPLPEVPEGDWHCPECRSAAHGGESAAHMVDPAAPYDPFPEPPHDPPASNPSRVAADPAPSAAPAPDPSTTAPPPGVSSRGRVRKQTERLVFVMTQRIPRPIIQTLQRVMLFSHVPTPPPSFKPYHPADPRTLEEALASPQSEDWLKATNDEIASLLAQNTFEVIDIPEGVRPIACKWVFKTKYDAFGFLTKFKVRLVAKGFLQKFGLDYSEVFSPVSKMTTLRLLLAYAAANNLELKQLDVATAFLNGELDEQVYVTIPPGLTQAYPHKCLHLRKAIYGLKQAPRVWWLKLSHTLLSNGFTTSYADTCLFYRQGKHGLVYLLTYVDDILAVGHSEDVNDALSIITNAYKCSEVEEARSFLGMRITRDRAAGTLTLSQPSYIDEVAEKHKFKLPKSHPSDPDGVTYSQHIPLSPAQLADANADSAKPLPPDSEYASLIGSLLYLANSTRPDISFAVSTLSRHLRAPTEKHMGLAKVLLRYVLSTRSLGLVYGKPLNSSHSLTVVGFSDSNYANPHLPVPDEKLTRRSVTGFVFLANGTPVSWQSKKQATVARSTDEAEYQAMATSASQTLWLRKLLAELEPPARTIKIYCDNMAALTHWRSPGTMNKTKHVDVQYQFVLDRQTRGDLDFEYIHTSQNLADLFTKALHRPVFERLRSSLLTAVPYSS